MIVDPDDSFPEHMEIVNDPLPVLPICGTIGIVTQVLVTDHGEPSCRTGPDPLEAALQHLAAPVAAGADGAELEALRVSLLNSANKLVASRRLTEAYRHEMDRAICGTPAASGYARSPAACVPHSIGEPKGCLGGIR